MRHFIGSGSAGQKLETKMLSNMRIGAKESVRSKFTLLGCLAVTGGVVLSAAFGCSSGGTATQPPGASVNPQLTTCNNGMIDPGEDCDGENLNNQTCATATMGAFTQGTLKCAADASCKF